MHVLLIFLICTIYLHIYYSRNKFSQGSPVGDTQRVDIHDKLTESENLMKQISQTWEEKLVKTERIQNERQQALEKMGISVQASGIKVEKNKYYLVNLNADPSLNELLVYYLKVIIMACIFSVSKIILCKFNALICKLKFLSKNLFFRDQKNVFWSARIC